MFQQRIDKLRQTFKEKNLDAFLISNFYNILYLSGFKTLTENEREGWMLVTSKNAYLFSDSRYLSFRPRNEVRGKLRPESRLDPDLRRDDGLVEKLITPEKGLIKHLQEIINDERLQTLGVEGDDLKINEFQHFIQHFRETRFIPTEKLIIKQREIKDNKEIEKIRKACQIGDECLTNIIKTIKVGQTEKEIAFKMEFWLKEKNYDLAFYPIVAIDENSAVPHYDTRNGDDKKIKNGSVILIDFGAKYQDYMSDITRMIFIGKPKDEMLNTYKKLSNTQFSATTHLRGGMAAKELDEFCRKEFNYPHSTGHGVGLEIHEYPKISMTSNDMLTANQIVTIEPGVYFEGKWGMRIEDTVVIQENKVEALTKFDKKLLRL